MFTSPHQIPSSPLTKPIGLGVLTLLVAVMATSRHAKCCNTPLGNTRPPALPFVSMLVQSFDAPQPDDVFGAPRGATFCKYAVGEPPADSTKLILLRLLLGRVLGWRLGGKSWPHPFFARETGAPIYPVAVVSQERREALRAQCGPRPKTKAVH